MQATTPATNVRVMPDVPLMRRRVMSVQTSTLGRLPALCGSSASGLLLIAIADTAARTSAAWASSLFWVGLLTLFVPIALRLLGTAATRRERIGLVVILGLSLYLVKVLHSPLTFTLPDELMHWRTASEIVRTGRLFGVNSILRVSPLYPGLENVTAALVSLTGLSIFEAGLLVVGAARLLLCSVLFLLYERVSHSPRIAGIAALLYMANPNFIFFGGMFAYESLALPIASLVVLTLAWRVDASSTRRVWLSMIVVLGLAAVVVSHHITTYALLALLGAWHAFDLYLRRRTKAIAPSRAVLLAIVMALTWMMYVASTTLGYVMPNLISGINELVRLIAGDDIGRPLFQSYGALAAPIGERIIGFASVGSVLVGLLFGMYHLWRNYRYNSFALAMALGGVAYPATLALRLTRRGAVISSRTSEFVFIAVAFIMAIAVVKAWGMHRSLGWRTMLALYLTVIFAGGTIVGWPAWARMPGSYLVGADLRSIDGQSTAAATWARAFLGPNNRMGADRSNRLVLGSFGEQYIVTLYNDRVNIPQVVFAPQFSVVERKILEDGNVRYLVIDRRISQGVPLIGVYFEQGEPDTFLHTTPVSRTALTKFDVAPGMSKFFDSGDIVMYDTGIR